MTLPDWLVPVRDAAETIEASHLTRFVPPEGSDARRGAVLMLFSEGPSGAELLLTERAHDMRSHPGQVSFPGGSLDPGEGVVEAALREAEEEVGVAPSSVEVFGLLPERIVRDCPVSLLLVRNRERASEAVTTRAPARLSPAGELGG